MNKPKDRLTKFYESYLRENKQLFEEDVFAQNMYKALLAGDTEVYQKNINENKIFDEKWIETLESYFPSIDKIMRNPKSGLMYEEDVVLIEKARKTTAQSVKHLSANTHLIRDIVDGEVRPKKIQVTFSEIDYATYDNRMVATLVERIFYFVRSRYEVIKEHGDSFQNKTLYFNSKFPFNEQELTLMLKLNIKEDPEDLERKKYNQKLLERVENLQNLINGFMRAPFMETLKKASRVKTPLVKTSVNMKNPDYHNCYILWLFLDRYNTLAFETEIKEKEMELDNEYLKSIYDDVVISLSTIMYHQEKRRVLYNTFDHIQKKKSIKVIRDLNVTSSLEEDLEITDENINQYYLEQNKKLFEQSLEYHQQSASTYDIALKRALRETVEFSNKLYESFFEFNDEEDVFRRLVTDLNPAEEIKQVRKMGQVAKAIREVKAVDFRKNIALETKFLNRVLEMNKKLEKNRDLYVLGVVEREKAEYKLKLEQEELLLTKRLLEEEIAITREEDEKLNQTKQKFDQMLRDLEISYARKTREAVEKMTKSLRGLQDVRNKQLEEEHDRKIRILKRDRELEIKMLEVELERQKSLYEEEYQKELERRKEVLKQQLLKEENTLRLKREAERKTLEKMLLDKISSLRSQVGDVKDRIDNLKDIPMPEAKVTLQEVLEEVKQKKVREESPKGVLK